MNFRFNAILDRLHRAGLAPARWIAGAAAACLLLSASAVQADTFKIEIDYMVSAGHSHQPSQQVIDAVVQMFACQGHTLIVDVDDAITHYNVLARDPSDCSGFFGYSGQANSYGALKALYFDHTEAAGWHYCIFAHQYEDQSCNTSGSSGLADGSWHFIVSLGGFSGQTGTLFDQAATLAHEFGHNLGLSHCGSMDEDDVGPRIPNLPSVMSYRYQLTGVRTNLLANHMATDLALFKDIDYSHGRMCSLNEDNLNETVGTYMTTTDWNCNGSLTTGVAQVIRGDGGGWCDATGTRYVLTDYNEWANIADASDANDSPDLPEVEYSCITAEEWAQVQTQLAGAGSQPTLVVEGCQPGRNVFIGSSAVPAGTCGFPFPSVAAAQASSPSNSVYFFKPGTYNESGVVTLNKAGIYMSNVGSATVK